MPTGDMIGMNEHLESRGSVTVHELTAEVLLPIDKVTVMMTCDLVTIRNLPNKFDQAFGAGWADNLTVNASGVYRIDEPGTEVALELVTAEGTETLFKTSSTTNGTEAFVTSRQFTDVPQDATIQLRAEGTAAIGVSYLDVRADTDGDGLLDATEMGGFMTDRFGTITTDPTEKDTDSDTVPDGVEIGDEVVVPGDNPLRPTTHYQLVGNPQEKNSDSDDLLDGTEYDGWKVDVFTRNGQPHRKYFAEDRTKYDDPGKITIHFDSDLLDADTDRDGLEDHEEHDETYTDPRDAVTYTITEEHQALIDDLVANRNSNVMRATGRAIGLIQKYETAEDLRVISLTDRTDDFDFVTSEPDSFGFTALDGKQRSDTWLSNDIELSRPGLDLFDPDTDDDGLTDGQENNGVTKQYDADGGPVYKPDSTVTYGTDPTEADDDGDGYWDGWIGVYGVGRTDNVVLYREHLKDDDDGDGLTIADGDNDGGVRDYEVVSEQTEIHDVSNTPTNGVYLLDRGGEWHSNVHIGEMHWEQFDPSQTGDPTRKSIAPNPELVVEVDWLHPNDPTAITSTVSGKSVSVLESTRRNLGLYGIEVSFQASYRDNITTDDLDRLNVRRSAHNAWELNRITEEHHNDTSAMHLLFAKEFKPRGEILKQHRPHDEFVKEGADGLAGHTGSPGQRAIIDPDHNGMYPFTEPYGVVVFADDPHVQTFTAAKFVLIHEMGHAFGVGWVDDKGDGHVAECYSGEEYSPTLTRNGCAGAFGVGGGDDLTPEDANQARLDWSIMSTRGKVFPGLRMAFSIEELSTIDTADIPTRDD